jgi:hypothetical protein
MFSLIALRSCQAGPPLPLPSTPTLQMRAAAVTQNSSRYERHVANRHQTERFPTAEV